MNILDTVRSLNFPADQYVVMGSAILDIKGIRPAEDLDIIVNKKLFDGLRDNPNWQYKKKTGTLGNIDVESLNHTTLPVSLYHHIYGGGTIDYFLEPENYEEIEGIKFASLQNLLKVKGSSWNRPKDVEDARLIKEYMVKHS